MPAIRLGYRVTALSLSSFLLVAAHSGDARAQGVEAQPPAEAAPAAATPAVAATPAPSPASTPSSATAPTPEAAPPAPASPPVAAPAPPVEEVSPFTGRLYGFVESRFNMTTPEPNGNVRADGSVSRAPAAKDLAVPAFHIMAQGSLYSRYRYYFNLAAPDADSPSHDAALGVRNAWLEASIFGDYLSVRVGKLYRRFGLYNEILDTTPSFIGIEAPVFLSGNRPMLTRTTNAMIHGKVSSGSSTLSYAVTGGKDEASANDGVFSPGFDLNYDWDSTILVGTSYYTTAGRVLPSTTPGAGSPAGGVAPWMQQDSYQVYGGYARVNLGSFQLHGEGWISPHKATRDAAAVQVLNQSAADFSDVNRARLAGTDVNYTYTTFDVRASYTFEVGKGADPIEITPYVDYQYIRNQESIADQAYGGDGQPGESPRGTAMHNRLGAVIKPVPQVAFKVEGTHAMYDYGTHYASDEELWLSLSYAWELIRK